MGPLAQLFGVGERPLVSLADLKAHERAERRAELGVPGTINQAGRLHVENNPDLQWERAYGYPGVITWGEWEKLARTDGAVVTGLEMVAAPLRDAELGVEPADETKASITQADFVRDNLLEWMEPLWPEFLQQALSMLTVGHSIFEVVLGLRPDKRVPGGKAVCLARLAQRLASSIKSDGWKEGQDGELEALVQAGYRGGRWTGDIVLPANRVLLFTWNRQGSNYQGVSALRPVWYLCKIREKLAKLIAIGHEREALGTPYAKPDKDVSLNDEQQDELQEFLENLQAHERTAIVMPAGVDLSWAFSPGANKGHVIDTYERLGKAVQEVLFSQQTYLGTSDTGSRSVGEVHADAKTQFVMGVKTVLEAVINGVGKRPYTGLVGRLVTPNFGEVERLPKVKLTLKRPEIGIGELSAAVPSFVSAGALTITLDDENALRGRLGLAPIDEEEREQLLEEKAARALEIAGGPAGDGEQDDDNEESQKEGEDDGQRPGPQRSGHRVVPVKRARPAAPPSRAKPPASPIRLGNFSPKRALYAEEGHLYLAEMSSFLDRSRDAFEQDTQDLVTEMVAKAIPDIRAAMADGDPSELLELQLSTERLAAYVEAFIERARSEGYRHVRGELARQPTGLLRRRAQGRIASVRLAAEEEKDDAAPEIEPEEQPRPPAGDVEAKVRKLVNAMRERLLQRMTARVIDDIVSEATYVARAGGDPEDVVSRVVQRALDTRGLRQDAGSVLTTAFNVGREQYAQEHAHLVRAVQYSAVLDGNVCPFCARDDGKQFAFNSGEHRELVPPHPDCEGRDNCRCLFVYLEDKTVTEVPE